MAHYRSVTHFKHNILSLRSLTSFLSDKNYRIGVNQALESFFQKIQFTEILKTLLNKFWKVFPVGNYILKVNDRNTRSRCELCSKLTIKTPRRRHVFNVNFDHILPPVLVFLLLTLSRIMSAGFKIMHVLCKWQSGIKHFLKIAQIRSYFWPAFSCIRTE